MIKTVFSRDERNHYNRITISGHSGFSESGTDIICSAVSSMMNLTARTLEKTGSEIKMSADPKIPEAGLSVISPGRLSDDIINSFLEELKEIKKEYSGFIDIKIS